MPLRLPLHCPPPSLLQLTTRRALITSRASFAGPLISSGVARYSTASTPGGASQQQRRRPLRYGLIGASAVGLFALLYTAPHRRSTNAASAGTDARPLAAQPVSSLLRSYVVWSLLSITPLIDAAPHLIEWAQSTSLPGVWSATEWIVRMSFFGQVSCSRMRRVREGMLMRALAVRGRRIIG